MTDTTISTQPIKFAQLNVQRKKQVTLQLLNSFASDFDILLIQEPAWSFIGRDPNSGKDINGPVALRGWTTILPVTSLTDTSPRPRTLTYFKPRPDYSITLRSDIIEDRDIQILDIIQTGHPMVTIINIYNDAPKGDQCILNRLRLMDNILPPHPTLITGDFNLHHPSWSREARAPTTDQLATTINDWLAQKNFTLLNKRGEITHLARHAGERPSVIDLSFANSEALAQDTFKEWAVSPDLALDSDHNAIKFTVDHGLMEIDEILPTKFCINKTDPGEWTQCFELELTKVEPRLAILNETRYPTDSQLDEYADILSDAIQNALAIAAPKRRPSKNTKPWWDQDLTNATQNLADARCAHQAYQNLTGEYSLALQTDVLQRRNFFKRLCNFKKRTWITETLENATPKDIWDFPSWSKGLRNYPTPPISRGPNTPKATSHEDKCEALRKELYQPPPALEHPFHPNIDARLEEDLPFFNITPEEIKDAIFKNKPNSAPGHSQITYQVLKWAWNSPIGQKHITTLLQKCLQCGYHPKSWRKAIAIALRKPNKPDYSNPRAYRLITLLECLAKILERIVANRLTFLAGQLNLVPPNQFGGRSNCSTDDAIITFITDIQTAWNHGKVTSALTFDIKGYFDFVNHDRLLCELRRKHIPLEYVKWTASFLSNREAAICIDGRCGSMQPVQNGIPQGSPASPILAAYYSAELLERFAITTNSIPPTITPSQPTPMNVLMYVDDGKLYVSSKSLHTNVILLQLAYKEVESWLLSAGLAPDLAKREIMHYSRRRKYDCSPPITLQDYDGTTRTLVPDKSVKWLGVHFDRKLLFNHHVKSLAARCETSVNGMAMLANTVRGLSQMHLRRLYLSCVIPKLLYACPAWWNNTKCQRKPLEKVQRKAMLTICAAFKTTPTAALEIEASIPPLKFQADLCIRRYAIRLNKLPTANPVLQRLPNEWRNDAHPSFPPPLPTSEGPRRKPASNLKKIAKFTNHEHERIDPFFSPPWCRSFALFPKRFTINPCPPNVDPKTARESHLKLIDDYKQNPNIAYLYTDGSKMNKSGFFRVGAGTTAFYLGNEVETGQLGLGGHAEVFDGEMAALALAASKAGDIYNDFPNITHLAFFTDNAASVSAIVDPKPRAAQYFTIKFHQTLRPLLEMNENLSISVSWCPSHCDIPGNDRADELAKAATSLERQVPFSVSRSNAKRRSKKACLKLWQQEWKSSPKVGRFAIANRIPPSLSPSKHFRALKGKREVFGRVVQCRSGHSYTGEFRRSFIPLSPDPSSCPCNEEILESRDHILRDCPRYEQHRNILYKASRSLVTSEILGTNEGIEALAEFLVKSGAFTRSGSITPAPIPPDFSNEPDPNMDEPRLIQDDGG